MESRFTAIRNVVTVRRSRSYVHGYMFTTLLVAMLVSLGLATSTVIVPNVAMAATSCSTGTYSATGETPCTSAPPGTYVDTDRRDLGNAVSGRHLPAEFRCVLL